MRPRGLAGRLAFHAPVKLTAPSKSRTAGGQAARADSGYAINLRVCRTILDLEAISSLPNLAIGTLFARRR